MMTHHVPVPRNFVNLGNLYSWWLPVRPPGWAYFEDGSIFIAPFGHLDHDSFETRMKVAANIVSAPTSNMRAIRQKYPLEKRFIVIK